MFVEISILFVTLWLALYLYTSRRYNHWKRKNVPFIKPVPFFGNAFDIFTLQEGIGQFTRRIYESTAGPFVGVFICDEPYFLIRDPELAKSVLVKDFNVFPNRSIHDNTKDDPMGSNVLFVMKTPDWRELRRKMTPVFTSGKMKIMFQLVANCGNAMIDYLKTEVGKDPVVDIREVSAKYTTDAITSTSFGINANCFKYENSEFRAVSRRVFNWNILERVVATSCYFVAPNFVKFFKLKFIDKKSTDFLREVFWKTMNERIEKKFVRNDLLDILIELLKQENINDPCKLEGDKLVAQATQFFVAGYETTSSTISFALYELAVHKEVQEKLRAEIKEVVQKHGEISYDAIKEMQYLDLCVKETLRKYPALPFLDRRANADYKIPGTDIILEKGTPLFIPSWGFHYDPKYFPDPHKFDPLRFTEENEQKRPPFVYLPFGEGPRNCIGARFGRVSSKSGLVRILSEFEVDLCEKTQHPLKLDPKGMLLAPFEQLCLKLTRL